jgi:hypothetical protein
MIEYDYKGIKVEATAEMAQHDYTDAGGHCRVRFDRNAKVAVRFWSFTIDGNLTELAYVKSILNYFMQCYWKRTSKEGSRIDLAKRIRHGDENPYGIHHSLNIIARQKNKKHYLEFSLFENTNPVGEVYLDGQEVIMLDIALGKAITLLTPKVVECEEDKSKKDASESKKKGVGVSYDISFG